ncbi:hypothetical protein PVIIG_05166 [Plasmodium vivax India VII]|uniref:Uncharacterized protein n=1 Tax=Plasmodium vivax India VII TaxID=1077284 RepID=A0A0J9S8K9_PLAVI|nr:hypothetical protein PVIIG_05166 [Plasmodium vivax India VII]
MGEAKRAGLLAEKKQDEGATGAANKNILFKECKHANEFRETFINVETDYSLDSEKEKNNIPLLKVFKKKLREEKACTRALITFQTSKEESRRSCLKEHLLKVLKQDHNRVITGACIFVHAHSIMLLESLETKNVFSFVRQLNGVKDVAGVQVLYFSELNKKSVTDDFAFFHYNKEQPKGAPLSGECNYVDETWKGKQERHMTAAVSGLVETSPHVREMYPRERLNSPRARRSRSHSYRGRRNSVENHAGGERYPLDGRGRRERSSASNHPSRESYAKRSEGNSADEVWELYINTLQFCCLAKNSAERQGIFDRNENIKKNFALLPHLYSDAARQYVWTADGKEIGAGGRSQA